MVRENLKHLAAAVAANLAVAAGNGVAGAEQTASFSRPVFPANPSTAPAFDTYFNPWLSSNVGRLSTGGLSPLPPITPGHAAPPAPPAGDSATATFTQIEYMNNKPGGPDQPAYKERPPIKGKGFLAVARAELAELKASGVNVDDSPPGEKAYAQRIAALNGRGYEEGPVLEKPVRVPLYELNGPEAAVPAPPDQAGIPEAHDAQTAISHKYVIPKGGTLTRVFRETGVKAAEIAKANGKANPNDVQTGEVITVPAPPSPGQQAVADALQEQGAGGSVIALNVDPSTLTPRQLAEIAGVPYEEGMKLEAAPVAADVSGAIKWIAEYPEKAAGSVMTIAAVGGAVWVITVFSNNMGGPKPPMSPPAAAPRTPPIEATSPDGRSAFRELHQQNARERARTRANEVAARIAGEGAQVRYDGDGSNMVINAHGEVVISPNGNVYQVSSDGMSVSEAPVPEEYREALAAGYELYVVLRGVTINQYAEGRLRRTAAALGRPVNEEQLKNTANEILTLFAAANGFERGSHGGIMHPGGSLPVMFHEGNLLLMPGNTVRPGQLPPGADASTSSGPIGGGGPEISALIREATVLNDSIDDNRNAAVARVMDAARARAAALSRPDVFGVMAVAGSYLAELQQAGLEPSVAGNLARGVIEEARRTNPVAFGPYTEAYFAGYGLEEFADADFRRGAVTPDIAESYYRERLTAAVSRTFTQIEDEYLLNPSSRSLSQISNMLQNAEVFDVFPAAVRERLTIAVSHGGHPSDLAPLIAGAMAGTLSMAELESILTPYSNPDSIYLRPLGRYVTAEVGPYQTALSILEQTIGERTGVTMEQLRRLNPHIADINNLHPGQRIILPAQANPQSHFNFSEGNGPGGGFDFEHDPRFSGITDTRIYAFRELFREQFDSALAEAPPGLSPDNMRSYMVGAFHGTVHEHLRIRREGGFAPDTVVAMLGARLQLDLTPYLPFLREAMTTEHPDSALVGDIIGLYAPYTQAVTQQSIDFVTGLTPERHRLFISQYRDWVQHVYPEEYARIVQGMQAGEVSVDQFNQTVTNGFLRRLAEQTVIPVREGLLSTDIRVVNGTVQYLEQQFEEPDLFMAVGLIGNPNLSPDQVAQIWTLEVSGSYIASGISNRADMPVTDPKLPPAGPAVNASDWTTAGGGGNGTDVQNTPERPNGTEGPPVMKPGAMDPPPSPNKADEDRGGDTLVTPNTPQIIFRTPGDLGFSDEEAAIIIGYDGIPGELLTHDRKNEAIAYGRELLKRAAVEAEMRAAATPFFTPGVEAGESAVIGVPSTPVPDDIARADMPPEPSPSASAESSGAGGAGGASTRQNERPAFSSEEIAKTAEYMRTVQALEMWAAYWDRIDPETKTLVSHVKDGLQTAVSEGSANIQWWMDQAARVLAESQQKKDIHGRPVPGNRPTPGVPPPPPPPPPVIL